MTRVLLLGASGMLGEAIRQANVQGVEVVPTNAPLSLNFQEACQTLSALELHRYDAVINTIGKRPGDRWTDATMAHVNGVVPHLMAQYIQDTPLIHVSTDCVFGPHPHSWTDSKPLARHSKHDANPDTLYGRTKLAGESDLAINVRTSFVGPRHGLWRWLVDHPMGARVPGWSHAWWSGSTVAAVARGLLELARDPGEPRVVHMATEKAISKFELLSLLTQELGLMRTIVPTGEPRIDRSLAPDIVLPPFEDALREMVP